MDEKEEYTDAPPSHILYKVKNMLYIKNKITSNTLAISKNNFEISNMNFKTLQSISEYKRTKVYGILGIVHFKNIPCLIFGTEFRVKAFYLDKAIYLIKNINYIILIHTKSNVKQEINKEFEIFKEKILNTYLIFSNYYDLTIPYYQQNGRNLNEVNSFLYNYEMIKPFLLNNNIKNKNGFYSSIIDGYIYCYNHALSGQEMILWVLYRKQFDINYFECEITIRYSTDVFDYIYEIKIGNEQFENDIIKYFEKKTGILFNISNNDNENEIRSILPYFHYIKYNRNNFDEKTIGKFFEEQNKEIKKTQYYYTCKDPLTGKIDGEYRQSESNQNGSCIFLFDDIESMTLFTKCFNIILFKNYFSQYQKEKDFNNQKNKFIQINKVNKIDYFYSEIQKPISIYLQKLKKHLHFNYKDYVYINEEKTTRKCNIDNLKLFIGTYNVSAIEPNIILSKFNVTSFLFPPKFSENISKKNLPDIVYICLEEIVELNPSNILISSNQDIIDLYTTKIANEICKHYPYDLKLQRNLVGVLTLFFIKSELNDQIDNLNVEENKTGNLGLGNKGNFIIKFKLNNQKFALANGHLSAGKENFDKRISEMKEIFDNIYGGKNKNILYFIPGDLNFRIELPKEKFNEICSGTSIGVVNKYQAKMKIYYISLLGI